MAAQMPHSNEKSPLAGYGAFDGGHGCRPPAGSFHGSLSSRGMRHLLGRRSTRRAPGAAWVSGPGLFLSEAGRSGTFAQIVFRARWFSCSPRASPAKGEAKRGTGRHDDQGSNDSAPGLQLRSFRRNRQAVQAFFAAPSFAGSWSGVRPQARRTSWAGCTSRTPDSRSRPTRIHTRDLDQGDARGMPS